MKSKINFLILFVYLVTFAGTGTSVYPHGPEEPHRAPFLRLKIAKEILDKLDLTQEQRKKIKALHEDQIQRSKELRKQLGQTMQNLHGELEKYQSDQNTVNRLINEVKNTNGQLFELKINSFLRMKEILTPQQFEKFKEEIAKQKELIKERRRGKAPLEEDIYE